MKTEKTAELKNVARFCSDIGVWAIDRPVSSCTHRSAFCRANCYNGKLYSVYGPGMNAKDERSESAWESMNTDTVSALFDKLERSPRFQASRRLRLMTRGEALSCGADIDRVKLIATEALRRRVKVWLPTRAWRNRSLWPIVKSNLQPFIRSGALRLLASTDPSDPIGPADGTSTMFFGDDDATSGRVRCRKTHAHVKGACATCRGGCFSPTERHIHLKQH